MEGNILYSRGGVNKNKILDTEKEYNIVLIIAHVRQVL